jgi:signal transduction histidine kinase
MSLRVGSRIFPKGQTALVAGIGSGSWALVQAIILPLYGQWFDKQWYAATFVSMAILPLAGTLLWLWLSRPWARAVVD